MRKIALTASVLIAAAAALTIVLGLWTGKANISKAAEFNITSTEQKQDKEKSDDKKKEELEKKKKEFEAKINKLIEKMKADGATEEEIKKAVLEHKKKFAAELGESCENPGEKDIYKMYKEKLEKKIEEMKAAGASEEEINKVIEEYKKKIAELKEKEKEKEKEKKPEDKKN